MVHIFKKRTFSKHALNSAIVAQFNMMMIRAPAKPPLLALLGTRGEECGSGLAVFRYSGCSAICS
jgi:hypothetical protein